MYSMIPSSNPWAAYANAAITVVKSKCNAATMQMRAVPLGTVQRCQQAALNKARLLLHLIAARDNHWHRIQGEPCMPAGLG